MAIPFRVPAAHTAEGGATLFRLTNCRLAERVVLLFFLYTLLLAFVYQLPLWQKVVCFLAPLLVLAGSQAWRRSDGAAIARDWLVPAVALAGYWQMGWFAGGRDRAWENAWLSWDRVLLDHWGLRSMVERQLIGLPWILELCYLLLYAIPPACLGVLYWRRARSSVDRFLATFALGTLAAYALLPVIAVQSPRIAFAGQDLPNAHSIWRSANLWILNHLDISTSVFPSGHVAVAFSSAFGIRRALPGSLVTFLVFLSLAVLVFVATIYGRYHYAADGLASVLICLIAWGFCEVYERLA